MADSTFRSDLPVEEGSNKRDRTSSPSDAYSPKETRIASSAAPQTDTAHTELVGEIPEPAGPLEADDDDSAFDAGSSNAGTSIRSSMLRGYLENGRRYSTLRGEGEVWCPSDEKSFEVFETTNLLFLILDSQRRNPLFQSPIGAKAQNVIDIGTGDGSWAMDVADKFPHLTVHGIDLYPPPQEWVAPNCILEVEDALKTWTWNKKFDLIHMRYMIGSFSDREWKNLYKQAYENLAPGGWIEHVEQNIPIECDDGTLPPDSYLAKMASVVMPCGVASGKDLETHDKLQSRIEEAGFTNVHTINYKVPIGEWPRLQVYKDAGRVSMKMFKTGLEGWMMWFMTKYARPEPWTHEEVQVWLAHLRRELDRNYHIYQRAKRVYAQKPFNVPKKAQDAELESLS